MEEPHSEWARVLSPRRHRSFCHGGRFGEEIIEQGEVRRER